MRVTNSLRRKVWQPLAWRYGKRGALLILGVPIALLIGGSATYAIIALGGGGSTSANAVNLQSGLVGWWQLNSNGKDNTPYSANGTLTGTTPTTDREGTANQALSFNGTTDAVSIGNHSQLQVTGSQTISMWVKPADFSARRNPYSKAYAGEGTITQETTGTVTYYYGTGGCNCGSSYQGFNSGTSLPLNTWSMITIVRNLSTMQLTWYINGSQVNQVAATYSAAVASTLPAAIGAGYVSNYSGSIDDVREYNRALSSTEVTALYKEYNPQLNAASGENQLLGWWKLDGNAKDATPHAINGATNGSPTPTTDREGAANSAYSFNGSTDYFYFNSAGNNYNVPIGGARTYSIWFKGNTPAATEHFFWKQGGCLGFDFNAQTNGQIQFSLTTGPSSCTGYSSYNVQTNTSYTDNKWHLATAVVDRAGGNEYLYIDGAFQKSLAVDNINSNVGGNLRIATNWNNSNPFTGSLDDARIYTRALSATEVANLYKSYNSQISLQSSGGSSVNLTNGLVGEWDFTGNAKDSTPYSDNGTVSGATLTTDRFGNTNSAYSFNGTAFITLGSNLFSSNNSGTLSMWVKPSTIASTQSFWGDAFSSGDLMRFYQPLSDPTTVAIQFDHGGTNNAINTPHNTLTTTNWYHVVVTSNGSSWTIYVNGVAQTLGVIAGSNQGQWLSSLSGNTYTMYIGQGASGYSNFNGLIDDVRIYNRALSVAEVSALYNLSY